jgi:hypothetical protein
MIPRPVGVIYNIPPQPPVEEDTTWFDAGALTIGVEHRALDPESLVETYKDNPEYLKEMLEKSPEGGFTDSGVTFHVKATGDGHEYVRFDMFETEPHYHYVHKVAAGEAPINNVVNYDNAAMGDMLPWAVERMRTNLRDMLSKAGGADVAAQIDDAKLAAAIDQAAEVAARAMGRVEGAPA